MSTFLRPVCELLDDTYVDSHCISLTSRCGNPFFMHASMSVDPKRSGRSPPVRQFDFAKTLYPQLPNEDANGNLVLAVDDAEEKQEENVMVGFN